MRPSLIAIIFFLTAFTVSAANPCVDINTATIEELEKIKHIGESRAKQIIALRGEKLFSSVDDLDRVAGIGPARVSDIKQEGLACVQLIEVILQQTPQPSVIATQTAKVLPQKIYYPEGIIINEIMPSPEGSDEMEEWFEIFNKNDFEIDLQGWQITDNAGKTNIYTFPAGIKISANGSLILSRQETKITLNNEGDGLNLIQPDGKIADSISYGKATLGQSYGPGAADIIPAAIKPSEETKKDTMMLAAVSEPVILEQSRRNFYPLTAFILAILSGFVILLLKHVRA